MNILIAEDEKAIRELLKMHLSKEGYEIYEAEDGIKALEIFKNNTMDLAILDVMMPKLDGFNLLRKIRETSEIPVIFLTAREDNMDKVLGLGLGADDYIVKPFSCTELVARVNANMRRSYKYTKNSSKENTLISIGNLIFDEESCLVYKKGSPIELNAKEFKMLKLFINNIGKVYTKKQLYEAIWDGQYYGDDNTVMVYISHLRDKIEDDVKSPSYIKTIRGIGYKFQKY